VSAGSQIYGQPLDADVIPLFSNHSLLGHHPAIFLFILPISSRWHCFHSILLLLG
jgi:hypothetical protein